MSPHHLAKIAAKELQKYLKTQSDFIHDFGLNKKSEKPTNREDVWCISCEK